MIISNCPCGGFDGPGGVFGGPGVLSAAPVAGLASNFNCFKTDRFICNFRFWGKFL